MAFTYNDSLVDAPSRVRSDVGDIAAPGLLPDATYDAVLAAHTSGEPAVTDEAAATRDIARKLAARYAAKPGSVTLPNGLNVSWAQRVAQWNRIADGAAGGASARKATGFTLRRGPFRDYTTGDGDV